MKFRCFAWRFLALLGMTAARRFLVALGMIIFLSVFQNSFAHCYKSSHIKTHKTSLHHHKSNFKTKMLAANFDSLYINGNYTVYLTRGLSDKVEVFGAEGNDTCARVEGNTLVIEPTADEMEDFNKQHIDHLTHHTIKIQMPFIHTITLNNNAVVYANNIASYGLVVNTSGNSRLNLKNVNIDVDKICARDNSYVCIWWINNHQLYVEGHDQARIIIAGVVKMFTTRMMENSCLDAKHLRPTVAFVQTLDYAKAQVLALKSLYTYATGDSNIYYYKTPSKNYLETSTFSGDILQMGHWN